MQIQTSTFLTRFRTGCAVCVGNEVVITSRMIRITT